MIICPIRLLWLMGLNHFITYHHPSSSYHHPSSSFHHNSSTPNTHHPPPNYELPRNRRISIQQYNPSSNTSGHLLTKKDSRQQRLWTSTLAIHIPTSFPFMLQEPTEKVHAPTRWQLSSKLKDIRSDSIPVLTSLTSANVSESMEK